MSEHIVKERVEAQITAIGVGMDCYASIVNFTRIYPDTLNVIYPTLGLTGEAGEVAEKVKKILRDKKGNIRIEEAREIAKELGDVLWYIAAISHDLGIPLSEVAVMNLDKLRDRESRGVLRGSGDNR